MLTLRQVSFLLLVTAIISSKSIATGPSSSAEGQDNSPSIENAAEKNIMPEAHAIVLKQLQSLQRNDQPTADAGIRTAWEYAHPSNQEATGPLSRFLAMVKGPTYRGLIDHHSHRIKLIEASSNSATFEVTVYPKKMGTSLLFYWSVATIESGDRTGEWATTAVSAPIESTNLLTSFEGPAG